MKYVCSEAQLAVLQNKISRIMDVDIHADSRNKYNIRSLYFDDYYNNAFYENENGVGNREKFRIRIYNNNPQPIRLEMKRKEHEKTQKMSCILSLEHYKALVSGRGIEHYSENPPVLQKLMLLMKTRMMVPKVIVEYDRTPFVYKNGNVRVTFDRNISSSAKLDCFFDRALSVRPIMPKGQHILEVKWDEYLPDFIYRSLQLDNLQRTSFSKYYLSRKFSLVGGIV